MTDALTPAVSPRDKLITDAEYVLGEVTRLDDSAVELETARGMVASLDRVIEAEDVLVTPELADGLKAEHEHWSKLAKSKSVSDALAERANAIKALVGSLDALVAFGSLEQEDADKAKEVVAAFDTLVTRLAGTTASVAKNGKTMGLRLRWVDTVTGDKSTGATSFGNFQYAIKNHLDKVAPGSYVAKSVSTAINNCLDTGGKPQTVGRIRIEPAL